MSRNVSMRTRRRYPTRNPFRLNATTCPLTLLPAVALTLPVASVFETAIDEISGACPTRPRVGERVHVVPNHVCPCINLYDAAWWRTADGRLERLPVDARGRLS
ncbi:MAG: hypothetical protein EBX36_12215 [Planctomycetia bacterium]|nr:hypothetical protein [Planctomycetia bacterium]